MYPRYDGRSPVEETGDSSSPEEVVGVKDSPAKPGVVGDTTTSSSPRCLRRRGSVRP